MESSTIEACLVAAVIALVTSPLVISIRRARPGPVAIFAGVLWCTVPVAVAWAAITLRTFPLDEREIINRPIELNEDLDGYVTSRTCEACHPGEHASWHRSYHRTMTQVATPETALGDFNDRKLSLNGWTYLLSQSEDSLWLETDDPGFVGESKARQVRRRIVMSTGSHSDQDYWVESQDGDRRLQRMPFEWVRAKRRWVPYQASFLAPPDAVASSEPGEWNNGCIMCHTTRGLPRVEVHASTGMSKPAYDSVVGEFGIACESCHGPAERHVESTRGFADRLLYYLGREGDDTIVNPAKLDHRKSSEVCGQCHSIWIRRSNMPDEQIGLTSRFGYVPLGPTPGGEFEETRYLVQHRYFDPKYQPKDEPDRVKHEALLKIKQNGFNVEGSFWPDGMVRVSGRDYSGMMESPCFERGELSCTSCHDLHKQSDDARGLDAWADDQLGPKMNSDHACVQCHPSFGDEEKLIAHSHHAADSAGSRCYNCHMSYTVYGVQKAIRSHHIDSPSVATSLATGRPNACNQCHLDQTMKWAAENLATWYGSEVPEFSEDEEQISAGVLWALGGHAQQRALIAWSMGWEPALEASGADWMTPFLSQLLMDPYFAVRLQADRSLGKHAGFENFEYDYVVPAEAQTDATFRARLIWEELGGRPRTAGLGAVLRDSDERFIYSELSRLLELRDDRPLTLEE